jgi:hypothetical protein
VITCQWLGCSSPATLKVRWRRTDGVLIRTDYFCEPCAEKAVFHPADVRRASTCRYCGEPIRWTHIDGQRAPLNMDGSAHDASCTKAPWRRYAEEAP